MTVVTITPEVESKIKQKYSDFTIKRIVKLEDGRQMVQVYLTKLHLDDKYVVIAYDCQNRKVIIEPLSNFE